MIPIIQQIAEELSQIPSVEAVILYGSRARGDHRERSDIDLAVVCPDASSRDWFDMTNIIDDARTLLKIDLVRYGKMQEEFREEIDHEGIVLFRPFRSSPGTGTDHLSPSLSCDRLGQVP